MKVLKAIIPLFILFLFAPNATIQAQSACSHVTFLIDSSLAIDETAVCEAANVWSENGVQLFIFLTDENPINEDDWFNILDQVEAEVGFRELDNADRLIRNLLALEASTANSSFATSITLGEDLFNTSIDSDANVSRLKNILQQNLASGNATDAFVEAIETAASINNLTSASSAPANTSAEPAAANEGSSAFAIIAIGLLVVIGLAGVGALAIFVARPIMARRKAEEENQQHLAQVRQSVANLLLAAEAIIDGDKPEEATLYALFKAYGGHHYEERDKTVREWLRQSQIALRDAFTLRSHLIEEEQTKKLLTEQIYNWEMIYLTLVGSSSEIQELTNEELQQLLDPFVVLERRVEDAQLARQLDELKRKIEGQPLKVMLRQVNTNQVDQAGILGYVSQIEAQIGELMVAEAEAPQALATAQEERLAAEEDASDDLPFGMTSSQLFGGIDGRLSASETHISKGLHLLAVETAVSVQRDLDIVDDLRQAHSDHLARHAQINALLADGYRPPTLENDKRDLAIARRNIVRAMEQDSYLIADDWIDDLDAASLQALENSQEWVTLHKANADQIDSLTKRHAAITITLDQDAQPAWEALQAYTPPNWEAITQDLQKPRRALAQFGNEQISHLRQLNSLDGEQELRNAESNIAASETGLFRLEQTIRAIINRLKEVKTAEINLPNALPLAQQELQRAVRLRNAEDSKISAEVDDLLTKAGQQWQEAEQLHAQQAYYPAAMLLEETRQRISEAHGSAEAQVAKIDQLMNKLAVQKKAAAGETQTAVSQSNNLNHYARTERTNELLTQLQQQRTAAHQEEIEALALEDLALAAALEATIAKYDGVNDSAQQTKQQIEQDKTTYENLYQKAQNQLQRAESKISEARRRVSHRDAHRAGRVTLERAITTLPTRSATVNASPAALTAVFKRAERALDYAEDAQRQADAAIRQTRQRRAFQSSRPIVVARPPRPSSGGWSSSSSSSSRPKPRSSRRSSFGSSSRRSSFGGSSRRSSSSGRSRRR